MPALIANSRKIEYSSRLKKFYSMMEQAIRMSELYNGQISGWVRSAGIQYDEDGDIDYEASGKVTKEFFMTYLAPYFKYTSIVDGKNIIDENGNKSGECTTIKLADGSTMGLYNGSCIDVIFDANGNVPPNTSGRDQYRFLFCFDNKKQIEHCGKENKVFCTYGLNNTNLRETILNKCKNSSAYCSRLLQFDGWEYKKDYPYRL